MYDKENALARIWISLDDLLAAPENEEERQELAADHSGTLLIVQTFAPLIEDQDDLLAIQSDEFVRLVTFLEDEIQRKLKDYNLAHIMPTVLGEMRLILANNKAIRAAVSPKAARIFIENVLKDEVPPLNRLELILASYLTIKALEGIEPGYSFIRSLLEHDKDNERNLSL